MLELVLNKRRPFVAFTLMLALFISPVQAGEVVTGLTVSSPAKDDVFAPGASFDCNGTITATQIAAADYIYLKSYDIDLTTIVQATNATWNHSSPRWSPGTLKAPLGLYRNRAFKMTADAMDNGSSVKNVSVSLIVNQVM